MKHNRNNTYGHRHSIILIIAMVILFCGSAMADSLNLYLENDSSWLKPNHSTDRHYTNGTKLAWVTDKPDWDFIDYFGNWAFYDTTEQPTEQIGLYLAQDMYTPDWIAEPAKRHDPDMSYAGWLRAGFFTARSTEDKLEYTELNMGVIGPSALAEEVQDWIHGIFGADKAVDWDTQIPDEFAINLAYYIRQKFLDTYHPGKYSFDMLIDYGLTVGSVFRHIETGLTMRYGIINPGDLGPGRYRLPIEGTEAATKMSSYLYTRIAARAVGYNRFLTGLSTEPVVGTLQAGIVININDFNILYSQTFSTDQYKQQHAHDSFGSLTISWPF